jgi:pyridoxamine 5'-phosphate oxidase
MSLADERRDYRLSTLDRAGLLADPIAQFERWYGEASRQEGGRWRRFGIGVYKAFLELFGSRPVDPNAMTLATVSIDGRPSARTVLLKGVDARGFIFFTNYQSRKGRELDGNPHASLVFYWPALERQVTVAGSVDKVPREESEAYFQSRPRLSQLGAWASDQSRPLESRKELEEAFRARDREYAGKPVPLPPFWGGYVLKPERIEFWQGRASRLHDRFQFVRDPEGRWQLERLSP